MSKKTNENTATSAKKSPSESLEVIELNQDNPNTKHGLAEAHAVHGTLPHPSCVRYPTMRDHPKFAPHRHSGDLQGGDRDHGSDPDHIRIANTCDRPHHRSAKHAYQP